jgi:hypothetical protein
MYNDDPNSEGGWLDTGFGGIEKEEARQASSRGPRRFFMKKNDRKQLIFVDQRPACIHEYNPKLNGSWTNWFTAPKSDPNYPDMESAMTTINKHLGGKYRDYYVGYFTVVDCTEWKSKDGTKNRYELKFFPAKMGSLKLIQSRIEDFGGIAGKAINVRRTDEQKSPAVGNVFDMEKEIDMDKLWDHVMYQGKLLKEHFAEALENDAKRVSLTNTFNFKRGDNGVLLPGVPTFNYMNLLKPKTPAELRTFLAGAQVDDPDNNSSSTTSSSGVGDGAADESIPF